MSRTELEVEVQALRSSATSRAYSQELRQEAAERANRLERRLSVGDFQVGDFIYISVRGQEVLTDTFAVRAGPSLQLPSVGTVDLRGVLHEELQDTLERAVGSVVREPRLEIQTLIRLSVIGGVGQPGYYVVPTQMLLSDVIMRAGGPARGAKLDAMRIERGAQVVWEGEEVSTAIRVGDTLEELGLRAGDRLTVPDRGQGDVLQRLRTAVYLVPSLIFAVSRLF
ncbi:MAG: SLBB domain-containing protein [Anaerolineales bacterium]|nr:SLBB domain-containing protein [Anaerolineales bacterium]